MTKQNKTILTLWFLLLIWLAYREGEWWENKIADYLVKRKPVKVSLKPKPLPYDPVSLPHPSREASEIPFVGAFDDYMCASASVIWEQPRFLFNKDPFYFVKGEAWHISQINNNKFYLIIPLKKEVADEIAESGAKKMSIDWE